MLLFLFLIVVVPFLLIMVLLKLHQYFDWPFLEKFFVKIEELTDRKRKRRYPIVEIIGVLFVGLFVLFAFRSGQKQSMPEFDSRVTILADSADFTLYEEPFKDIFERTRRTPQPEQTFYVQFKSDPSVLRNGKFQFIIIPAVKDDSGKPFMTLLQDEDVRRLMANDDALDLYVYSTGAKNQTILVIAAADQKTLLARMDEQRNQLYHLAEEYALSRIKHHLFAFRHEKKVSERLMEKYGWTLEKHGSLFLSLEDTVQNIAAFTTENRGQYCFVHWIDDADSLLVNEEWILQARDRIGRSVYGGMYTDRRHYLFSEKVDFRGRKGRMTRGLWIMDDPVMGGPFTNYTFYDSNSGRVYMIEVFVFNPGEDKLPVLRTLEAVANTFTAKGDDAKIKAD